MDDLDYMQVKRKMLEDRDRHIKDQAEEVLALELVVDAARRVHMTNPYSETNEKLRKSIINLDILRGKS
jgi:hypothetical protein